MKIKTIAKGYFDIIPIVPTYIWIPSVLLEMYNIQFIGLKTFS